jgi:hypothetical protein
VNPFSVFPRRAVLVVAALAAAALPRIADAQCFQSTIILPPTDPGCAYVASFHTRYNTAIGPVDLSNSIHDRFRDIVVTNLGPDQQENFHSRVRALIAIAGGPPAPFLADPVDVTTMVFGKNLSPVGTFNTEMLQLDINAGGGIRIRESPTLASTGQTTITDIGGGNFRIDSFFDVFTELSLDDGTTWIPGEGPAHVTATTLPEPATVALLSGGLLALGGLARRRRTGRG